MTVTLLPALPYYSLRNPGLLLKVTMDLWKCIASGLLIFCGIKFKINYSTEKHKFALEEMITAQPHLHLLPTQKSACLGTVTAIASLSDHSQAEKRAKSAKEADNVNSTLIH